MALFERFTDEASASMAQANLEAQRLNHEYVGTEHILLGLIKKMRGVAAEIFKRSELDARKVRLEVEKLTKPGPDLVTKGKLPMTPRAKKVIEYAYEESRNLMHEVIGGEHLLLGLLREHDGVAAQILMNLGMKLEEVREELLTVLADRSEADENSRVESEAPAAAAIELYLEPGEATQDEIRAVLRALNDLHVAAGGLGLEFHIDGTFIKATQGVPA